MYCLHVLLLIYVFKVCCLLLHKLNTHIMKDVSGCKVKCDLFNVDLKFRQIEKSLCSQYFAV